jgi:hypothetical protein
MLRAGLGSVALLVAFAARWGGDEKDVPTAMALDDRGGVIVVGNTHSRDFPTTTGQPPNCNWCAFSTKLDARSGAAIYSTVLCTSGMTFAFAAAPGLNGEIWVAGSTDGADLPVTSDAAQPRFAGSSTPIGAGDVMLMRWSADGRTIRYATYFGGSGDERANALAADGHGGVWVAGETTSRDLPSIATGAPPARAPRGFVAHVDARGTVDVARVNDGEITAMTMIDSRTLALATINDDATGAGGFFLDTITHAGTGIAFGLIGGNAGQERSSIHFRSITSLADRTIVIGGDSNFCRPDSRFSDGMVVVMDSWTDRRLPRARRDARHCIGGSGIDEIHGVAAAPDGSVWVTGLTDSPDFPPTGSGARADYDKQAFVAQIDPKTGAIRSAALLGESVEPRGGVARGYAIAVAQDGRVFVTAEATGGSIFRSTRGAFKAGLTGSTDIYLVSFRARRTHR